jgi:hypothetical protein
MTPAGESQPGIAALITRRHAEILARLRAAEWTGTPDPDETDENIAGWLLEWEARKAFGWERTYSHEEVMREMLAPTFRWEAYLGDPSSLDAGERERLDAAGALVLEKLGISQDYQVRADKSWSKLADVIALLVLQRELWEPCLRKHPRPWTGPIPA